MSRSLGKGGEAMEKSNLKFNLLSPERARFIGIISFSLLLFFLGSPQFLFSAAHAKNEFTVTEIVGDAEYAILAKAPGGEGFIVNSRGKANIGDVFPREYCTVCVTENSTLVLADEKGEKHRIAGPVASDLWTLNERAYKKDSVAVKEGTVWVQRNITDENGKLVPAGPTAVLHEGSTYENDPCFAIITSGNVDFEGADGAVQAAEVTPSAVSPAALPSPDPDPVPKCASAPCPP